MCCTENKKKRDTEHVCLLVSTRAYQPWYNIFSLTTNQYQPGLLVQKPTSEPADREIKIEVYWKIKNMYWEKRKLYGEASKNDTILEQNLNTITSTILGHRGSSYVGEN